MTVNVLSDCLGNCGIVLVILLLASFVVVPFVIDSPECTRSGDETDEHGQPTAELDR